jgi:hypothetical protein
MHFAIMALMIEREKELLKNRDLNFGRAARSKYKAIGAILGSSLGVALTVAFAEGAGQGKEGSTYLTITGIVLAGAGVVFGKSYIEDAMSYHGTGSVADQQHTDLINQRVFEEVTTRPHNY